MTELLEKAFAEVSKLPELEQDVFSRWILEEVASEKRWDMAFANSQDLLSRLADEALAEHRAGKTKEFALQESSHNTTYLFSPYQCRLPCCRDQRKW